MEKINRLECYNKVRKTWTIKPQTKIKNLRRSIIVKNQNKSLRNI